MAKTTKATKLYRKAETALISAIEIYNKPDFNYREEAFAILALNAWELLLKAKLLRESGNKLRCLRVYESRKTRTGAFSKKQYLKRNRAGNPHTLGLRQTIASLEQNASTPLAAEIRANLDALTEIRDNAVHYINGSPQLAKRVLEVGTAAIRNFIELAKRWFKEDLSRYSLFLMPIGFLPEGTATALARLPDAEQNLLKYLSSLAEGQTETSPFQTLLDVQVSMRRVSAGDGAGAVVVDRDNPNALPVTLTEEQIREKYPWDYNELTRRLQDRYTEFRVNKTYHDLRRGLQTEERFAKVRYLDPGNPKSAKKRFFNPNIVAEFDKHYTRKAQ